MQRNKRNVGQASFEKPFFLLNGGLNTEASPLNAPDNTTIDECNLEILRDGSRRRRRALRLESGGVNYEYDPLAYDDIGVFSRSNTFQWDNVGGDTSLTFQVIKVGGNVHFYVDDTTLSANKKDFVIPLMDFATTDTLNDVIGNPVTFTSHQGILFASAKYVTPIYIEYSAATDDITITPITIRARDFAGIADEVAINSKPSGTLTDSHKYNLINRGWKAGTTTTDGYLRFETDTGYWPAKNMIPWKGYNKKAESTKNISTSEFNPADWSKSYSSDKLEAEIFGEADAPQGHILVNPFDTSFGQVGSGVGAQDATVTAITSAWTGTGWLQITMSVPLAHGLAVSDPVEITGGYITWYDGPGDVGGTVPITGVWPAYAGTAGTTIVIRVPVIKHVYNNAYDNPGLLAWTGPTTAGVEPLPNTVSGVATNQRPTAIEMFAGRMWYGGFGSGMFSDTIMFSQLILNSVTDYAKYGKCFQAGDPTDEFRSLVVPTDGGTVQIPGLAGVKDMIATQASLLVFADSGVYEITGGNAPFSANNFIVRTITDAGAWSAAGITSTEFGIVYTSPRGIFAVAPDGQSGRLAASPIIDDNIKTLWNAIPDLYQRYAHLVYDYCLQKLYLLYTDSTRADTGSVHFDSALVYDLRNKAWYRLRFPTRGLPFPTDIRCAIITKAGDGANENKKVKFIATYAYISGVGITVLDLDHTTYVDYNNSQELPYLITAYDGIGGADVPRDFAHKRQAPVVHVYSKRTETGVDINGEPVNTSSILVEPRWDFTDVNNTGRAGSPQQAYRTQQFHLGDPTDNGMPVVVSRLKVRGRGKSLHFKFYGEADKDFHLLGYAILYKIGRHA